MSTHPILPDTKIPFPCWLYHPQHTKHLVGWVWWKYFPYLLVRNIPTHYSTLPASQRPEGVPTDEEQALIDDLKALDFPVLDSVADSESAPHPTLAQLAEGAAKQVHQSCWHGLKYEEMVADSAAQIVRVLSPEWERMVRENEHLHSIGTVAAFKEQEAKLSALRAEVARLNKEREAAEKAVGTTRLRDALNYIRERQLPGSTYRAMVFSVFHEISKLETDLAALRSENERLTRELERYHRRCREHTFVDATPDSCLPRRILESYIDESSVETNPPELGAMMNQWQSERNAIIREALAGLVELQSLRARVREMEEDKARIDSIERAQRCIMCLHNEAKNRAVWSVTFEDQHHTEYDTLREAMDALAADEARLDAQKSSAFDAARKGETQS